jgi:hypothetical protein
MYVNSNAGYLVADEATCESTDRVYYAYDCHNQIDAAQVRASYKKAAA